MEEKAQTHFPQSEGKNQSGKVNIKFFECLFRLLFDLNVVEGKKTIDKFVITEACFNINQLLCVNEFEGLSPNVEKRSILRFVVFVFIFDVKDPQSSEFKEESPAMRMFLAHFDKFGIVVEGKTDLADGGRLFIFAGINNEVLL